MLNLQGSCGGLCQKMSYNLHMYKFWFDKGYNVIPIKPDSKHPPLVMFNPFRETRITKEQLEQWWACWPGANVGVLCGGINRLAVLDCDGEDAASMIKCLGLPETASVRTPHGRHLYFRVPEGYTVKTVPQGGLRVNGCELRAEGAYVIAPPSTVNGLLYYWETPLSAGIADLRDVPREVVFFDDPFGAGAPPRTSTTFNERLKGVPEGGAQYEPRKSCGQSYSLRG